MIRCDSMVSESAHAFRQIGARCSDHSTFARGNYFDGMKTKSREVRQLPDGFSLIASTNGVTGVGDQGKASAFGQVPKFIVVTRGAGIVNGNYRLGSGCDFFFNAFGINEQCIRV